jgi:hypothetical protein
MRDPIKLFTIDILVGITISATMDMNAEAAQ